MTEDLFADVDLSQVERRQIKGKGKFLSPGADTPVNRAATQKATGDTAGMHGQYKQANFKLKLETLDEIDAWAEKLRCNKSQLKRYLAWRGLRALEEGERPEYSPGTVNLADHY
jgi:hypothetical protein